MISITADIRSHASSTSTPLVNLYHLDAPPQISLYEVLHRYSEKFEELRPPKRPLLTGWIGTPPPEESKGYTLHIHVPGQMTPVVEVDGKEYIGENVLKKTTLNKLCIKNDLPTTLPYHDGKSTTTSDKADDFHISVRIHVSHRYVAPKQTEEEKRAAIDRFQSLYNDAVDEYSKNEGYEEDITKLSQELARLQNKNKPSPIPKRRSRIFMAASGMLPIPVIPDEFYDQTDNDAKLYVDSIKKEAELARQQLKDPQKEMKTELKAKRGRRHLSDVVVRVKLVNRLYLESVFDIDETVGALTKHFDNMLEESIRREPHTYVLSPPPQRLDNPKQTLRTLGFGACTLLHFSLNSATVLKADDEAPPALPSGEAVTEWIAPPLRGTIELPPIEISQD